MPPTRNGSTSAGPSSKSARLAQRPSRQQNSACAPCRGRRVKCDRKDVPPGSDVKTICTECLQRDFQCVDDVREAKPVKRLRQGRKIQELKGLYANSNGNEDALGLTPSPNLERLAPSAPSAIPALQLPFFQSPFYRRFHVQRPIVDPNEFTERFERHAKEGAPLGTYGELIAKLLVTWAASYGVNERGEEEPHGGLESVRRRNAATNVMVKELLHYIDKFGVMRNISWDGVRVLLLLMPLTEEVQNDTDRAAMYQSTVLQVYSLSNLSEALQVNEVGIPVDQMVRARIFWYGHVHEGLTNGLKGKKLIFDQDDVDAFRSPLSTGDYNFSLSRSPVTITFTYQYATAPIRLSAACRLVNTCLTGPKAERSERVDRAAMNRVWSSFADSWEEFESLRVLRSNTGGMMVQNEETDRFVSGWQIFIFEALNVIREKLADRIARIRNSRIVPAGGNGQLSPTLQSCLSDLTHLHDIAESKCDEMCRRVLDIIKRHLNTPFFDYDASLCRDGVYYAGERVAGEANSGEDVDACLKALVQMRWAYSKSAERTEKLKSIWESRQRTLKPPAAPSGPAALRRALREPSSYLPADVPAYTTNAYNSLPGLIPHPPRGHPAPPPAASVEPSTTAEDPIGVGAASLTGAHNMPALYRTPPFSHATHQPYGTAPSTGGSPVASAGSEHSGPANHGAYLPPSKPDIGSPSAYPFAPAPPFPAGPMRLPTLPKTTPQSPPVPLSVTSPTNYGFQTDPYAYTLPPMHHARGPAPYPPPIPSTGHADGVLHFDATPRPDDDDLWLPGPSGDYSSSSFHGPSSHSSQPSLSFIHFPTGDDPLDFGSHDASQPLYGTFTPLPSYPGHPPPLSEATLHSACVDNDYASVHYP